MGRRRSVVATYRDAVVLLEGDSSRLVKMLDSALGLGLLIGVPVKPSDVLSLFDAKDEAVELLDELVAGVGKRISKVPRGSRSELILAAHAVLVLAAFMDVLKDILDEFGSQSRWMDEIRHWVRIREESKEKRGLQTDRVSSILSMAELSTVAPPSPSRPFVVVENEAADQYAVLGRQVLTYFAELRIWEQLNETQRARIERRIIAELPKMACRRFRTHYARLCGEVPDFFTWAYVNDTQFFAKTLNEIKSLELDTHETLQKLSAAMDSAGSSLEALERITTLSSQTTSGGNHEHSDALRRADRHHRLLSAELERSLFSPSDADDLEVSFPSVQAGYIEPSFRLARLTSAEDKQLLSSEEWWTSAPVRRDLPAVLAAMMATPEAVNVPCLVLGHPGSGKTLLSKLVGARMPPSDVLCVRVELRHVDARQDVTTQIDDYLRRESNLSHGWRELADNSEALQRLVILDGLDELLQLSDQGSYSDYLDRVAAFQERERLFGLPVTVLVTCRTIVMDRVRVPTGSTAIKLEDLNDVQIAAWLQMWRDLNETYYRQHEIEPCSIEWVSQYPQLSRQPLLLMLLVLFHAQRRHEDGLIRTESALYEGLFAAFAERQVRKAGNIDDAHVASASADMLWRLGLIGAAMTVRGSKFLSRRELVEDLVQLGGLEKSNALAEQQVLESLEGFMFIHSSQARPEGVAAEKGYEFLHATFGEYLTARLLVRLASGVPDRESLDPYVRARWSQETVSRLAPVLSKRSLASEDKILAFLYEIAVSSSNGKPLPLIAAEVERTMDQVTRAIQGPTGTLQVQSAAFWSSNAVLLSLVWRDSLLPLPAIFGDIPEWQTRWSRMCTLWASQLEPGDWASFLARVRRSRDELGLEPPTDRSSLAKSLAASLEARALLVLDPELQAMAQLWRGASDLWPTAAPDFVRAASALAMGANKPDDLELIHGAARGVRFNPSGRPTIELASLYGGPFKNWSAPVLASVAKILSQEGRILVERPGDVLALVTLLLRFKSYGMENELRELLTRGRITVTSVTSIEWFECGLLGRMAMQYDAYTVRQSLRYAFGPGGPPPESSPWLGPDVFEWLTER